MQKMTFMPQIVFEILNFKKSCNPIGQEHFCLNSSTKFSQNMQFLQNHKGNYGASYETNKSTHQWTKIFANSKNPTDQLTEGPTD